RAGHVTGVQTGAVPIYVINGGNGADTLTGGDGNDTIDGNRGSDTVFMGNGNDTAIWDPGDGSDIIEGQAGQDTLRFNGSAGAEKIGRASSRERGRVGGE